MAERTFWDHIQALSEMAASVPDQRLWLDGIVADLPGIEPRARQSLRPQMQLVVSALPAIAHLARDTGAAPMTPVVGPSTPAKPPIVPYR